MFLPRFWSLSALDWGSGAFHFNLVAALFGTTVVSSIVYVLVGLAGVYQVAQWKAMQYRWQPARE